MKAKPPTGRFVGLALCLCLTLLAGGARAQEVEPPVLLGFYGSGPLHAENVISDMLSLENWLRTNTGVEITLAGTFMDLEWPDPANNVVAELNQTTDPGNDFVPFINLLIGTVTDPYIDPLPLSEGYPQNRTAAFLADNAAIEPAIRAWAQAFANWSNGGQKRAFIAPLPEMNGTWVTYGLDPDGYRRAFKRLQDIFQEEGVVDGAVNWVFAPNGWSDELQGHPPFEDYYPGNTLVDVVGLSAFNFGACSPWPGWDTYELAMEPYLERVSLLTPSKPIFITQTGTVQEGGDKNAWLEHTYTQLAAYPGLRAILYFHTKKVENGNLSCVPVEWRFYAPQEGLLFDGILDPLGQPEAGYGTWKSSAPEWTSIGFAANVGGNTFEDLEPAHPFAGVDDPPELPWVEALNSAGRTAGCGLNDLTGEALFCPNQALLRGDAARILLQALHGADYIPPAPDGSSTFNDIQGHEFEAWIEQLYDEGLAGGGSDYRPDEPLTRSELAVFLLRARNGSGYTPPPAQGGIFNDIAGHWAQAWIEALSIHGIADPDPDGGYKPDQGLYRAQSAEFLVRALGLPGPYGTPGDLNEDGRVDAADAVALTLEINDGDGALRSNASGGSFAAPAYAADIDGNGIIDQDDFICLNAIAFQGNGACHGAGALSDPASVSNDPAPPGSPLLKLPDDLPAQAFDTVSVPIEFRSQGTSISALLFSIDLNPEQLTFDSDDQNLDGIPDGLTLNLPPGFATLASYDASDSDAELDILIYPTDPTPAALPDSTLASLNLGTRGALDPIQAPILFASGPPASFGDDTAAALPGDVEHGSVAIAAFYAPYQIFLPAVNK